MVDIRTANLTDLDNHYGQILRRPSFLESLHNRPRDPKFITEQYLGRGSLAIQKLLRFYGIIEIACVANLLPSPLPQAFANKLIPSLHTPFILSLLKHDETSTLVPHLMDRLDGRGTTLELHPQPHLFIQFLSLDHSWHDDPLVSKFVSLLLDDQNDYYTFLLRSLQSESLAEQLTKDYELRTCLFSMERLLLAADDLLKFRRIVSEAPLLERAIGAYYRPLFSRLSQADEKIMKITSAMKKWYGDETDDFLRINSLRRFGSGWIALRKLSRQLEWGAQDEAILISDPALLQAVVDELEQSEPVLFREIADEIKEDFNIAIPHEQFLEPLPETSEEKEKKEPRRDLSQE